MFLALETSSLVSSVALGTEDRLWGELTVQASLTHSEQLVPHVDHLLRMTGQTIRAIEGIFVSQGPGSFTGLRIGLATAKSMAYGLGCPLVGVSTMEVLAYGLPDCQHSLVPLIDAQKEQVYMTHYRWRAGVLEKLRETEILPIAEALSVMCEEDAYFMGDGSTLHAAAIVAQGQTLAPAPFRIPRAQALLLAGCHRFRQGQRDEVHTIAPFYLRRSEAEVLWEKRHGHP